MPYAQKEGTIRTVCFVWRAARRSVQYMRLEHIKSTKIERVEKALKITCNLCRAG